MEFIETSVFTRQVTDLLSDQQYKQLQQELVLNPLAGKLIAHSGGLRKVRVGASGRGKRGGARVIYYYLAQQDAVFLLLAYGKSEKDDLTQDELRILRRIVEKELT